MRTLRLACALLCSWPLVVGCASTSGPAPAASTSMDYRIGPSDELTIRVLPEPSIEREVTVAPDGTVAFDLIGKVEASGRTPAELADEIERRIGEFRLNPSVSVALDRAASASITVLGEVQNRGLYPVEKDLHLTEAIARAGGSTERAAASRVRLIRRHDHQSNVYLANLDEIHEGDLVTDYEVMAGDMIFVPPDRFVAFGYALGRVLYPLEVVARIVLAPFYGFAGGN